MFWKKTLKLSKLQKFYLSNINEHSEYKKTNKNSKIRFENNLKSKVKNNLSKKVSKTKDHDEKIVIDTNKIPDQEM